jgi:hypothetical protein
MKKLCKQAEGKMDDDLLMYYSKEWERFTTAMKYINNIFDYLVRSLFFCCSSKLCSMHFLDPLSPQISSQC